MEQDLQDDSKIAIGKAILSGFMKYYVPVILFVIGISGAVELINVNKPEKKATNVKPKSDTVFVKLVDPLTSSFYQNEVQKSDTNHKLINDSPYRKQQNSRDTSNEVLNLPLQTGRTLLRNNPLAISGILAIQEKENSKEFNYTNIYFLTAIGGFILAVIILIVLPLTRDPNAEEEVIEEVDPPDMQQLLDEFKNKINELRNPRKILRFKNLAKYHYYFLAKNDITDIESLRKMMYVLFGIQDDPEITNVEKVASKDLFNSKWFFERLQLKDWFNESKVKYPEDNDLIMEILKLNVDMGS